MTTRSTADEWYEGRGNRRLVILLRTHRSRVASLISASILGGLIEAGFLVAVTSAALAISKGEPFGVEIGPLSLAGPWTIATLIAMALIRVVFAVIAGNRSAALVTVVVRDVRTRLIQSYLGARFSVQHGQESGRLQELLTTFTQQTMATTNALAQGLVSGCTLLVLLVAAVVVNPLAALAVVALGAALMGVLRPMRKAVRRQAKANAESGMEFATAVAETSHLALESHVFDVHDQLAARLDVLTADHESSMRRLSSMRSTVSAVYTGLAFVALAVAIAIGAEAGTGQIQSVGAVMLVMLRSLTYGQALLVHSTTIQSAGPFIDQLRAEIHRYADASRPSGTLGVDELGTLSLDHVTFTYDGSTAALRDVTLEIPPREVIGIVGPSGSGKSTLVQLLLGLRSPTKGHVVSNGRPIEDFIRSEWARKVTFVPQEPRLIAGTVAENIRFFRDDISDEDIVRAARLAHLDDEVERFPLKYERQVGEMGSELSGGQKQRLIIARALVEDPDVIILDEPTSALDVRSEAFIRQTLDELRSRMTVIVIAHRLSTLDICDRIMVIEDGEVKAFDTPDELRESSDFYRESLRLSGLE